MHLSPLTLHDCAAWAALLAIAFNRSHAEMAAILDHLHAVFPMVAWGAWDGDVLAAQYSSLLTDLHIPGASNPALVGVCINMATHPDYRGQGLIKQVAQPVYADVRARGGVAGVGFSNADGVRVDRRSHSYGYRVVGQMQSRLAILRRRPAALPLTPAEQWPDLAAFPARDSLHFAPTAAWLRYRFDGHPQRIYRFAVWSQAGQIGGAVAYRLMQQGAGATLLAAYGPDPAALIQRWTRTMWDMGVRVIHLLATPGTPWVPALRQTAWVLPLPISRHPYYLTVKPLGVDAPAALFDFAQWDCLGGDIL